jgi:hypothetical protein
MEAVPETKQADGRGRVSLGLAFANRTLLVETADDCIVIRPARVIPEREAWLYQNKDALAQVRAGLAESRNRKFAKPPSLEDARRLAAEIPEE